MKRLLLLVAAILSLAIANAAEYVTLHVTAGNAPDAPLERTIETDPTDLIEILVLNGGARLFFTMEDDTIHEFSWRGGMGNRELFAQVKPPLLTGVKQIELKWAHAPTFVTFKFTPRASTPNSTPSNVAVIPNDANGQFEVILESSVDLVTWNVANPGTFGGDTPRRFFRTRIVRKN